MKNLQGEYSPDEISEIIFLLSKLYQSIGGDKLEIKRMESFEFIAQFEPEFA